jgi:hypothetical protein
MQHLHPLTNNLCASMQESSESKQLLYAEQAKQRIIIWEQNQRN